MERLPTLPATVFSRIVAFTVDCYAEELVPKKRKLPVEGLRKLALVAKAWVAPVCEIVERFQRSTVTLGFQTASRSELMEFRRKLYLLKDDVCDLRISMGSMSWDNKSLSLRPGLRDVDSMTIGWDALLALVPRLHRLDLLAVPTTGPHIKRIVEAAGKHCRELEALILPGMGDEDEQLMQALYGAMKKWQARNASPGIRQLTLPIQPENDRFRSSVQLLEHVAAYCPNVEYLDGYKRSFEESERFECEEQWYLPLSVWERFNASCTQLREFDWVVVPFADPFFRVFGQHAKPQLSSLSFGVNMLWDWAAYFEACGEDVESCVDEDGNSKKAGYGSKACDVSAALKGCPNLKELDVTIYPLADDGTLDCIKSEDMFDYWSETLPKYKALNPEFINDAFCEAVADCCPKLEWFTVGEAVDELEKGFTLDTDVEPIQTFTDRGLVALRRLDYLSNLELRSVNVSGDGLFEFLSGLSHDFRGSRSFEISLGGCSFKKSFFDAFEALMKRIDATDPANLRFADEKFYLFVRNAVDAPVDPAWVEAYFARMKPLVRSVRLKHPSLCIEMAMNPGGDSQFEVYTAQRDASRNQEQADDDEDSDDDADD